MVSCLLGLVGAAVLITFTSDLRAPLFLLALSAGIAGGLARLQLASRPKGLPQSMEAMKGASGLPTHPVTGLYLPWVFRQRLSQEVARAQRYQRQLAVVLLEIADRLADAPAETFAQAAQALRATVRESDFVAQFDEERFAALLTETELDGAQAAGQHVLAGLRAATEGRFVWRGAVAAYPEDGADADALIARAEAALRQSRREAA
jgi:two-component system cell cycle response regulator